jgi:hypothetical protein
MLWIPAVVERVNRTALLMCDSSNNRRSGENIMMIISEGIYQRSSWLGALQYYRLGI